MNRPLVIIESPYAGDVEANVEYARLCVKDSLKRGEAPIASHLLYTQPGILNDDIPSERQWGIDAGLAWKDVAYYSAVYIDRGISLGMLYGMKIMYEYKYFNGPLQIRSIEKELTDIEKLEVYEKLHEYMWPDLVEAKKRDHLNTMLTVHKVTTPHGDKIYK